MNHSKKLQP